MAEHKELQIEKCDKDIINIVVQSPHTKDEIEDFIVLACNNFPALLDACEDTATWLEKTVIWITEKYADDDNRKHYIAQHEAAIKELRTAIAAAKEK
jgi:hypothetical protein